MKVNRCVNLASSGLLGMNTLVSFLGPGDRMKSSMLLFHSLLSTKNCNMSLATEKCLDNTSGSRPRCLQRKERVNSHGELEELVSAF